MNHRTSEKVRGEMRIYKCDLCGQEYEKPDYGHVCGFKHIQTVSIEKPRLRESHS